MRLFLLGVVLLSASAARSEQVVIRNPLFQGKPIFARANNDVFDYQASRRAHIACRLAGFAQARTKGGLSNEAYFETSSVARANLSIVEVESLVDRNNSNFHQLGYGDLASQGGPIVGLLANAPRVRVHRKVHPCAEVAVCRGHKVNEFWSRGYAMDTNHPYVRACYNWGTRDRKEPQVFSSITCETNRRQSWQITLASATQEWLTAHPSHRIVGGTAEAAGIIPVDPIVTCAKYPLATNTDLRRPEIGECNYVDPPYRAGWEPRRIAALSSDNFMMYLILTGRWESGPHPGPACVGELLERYTPSVLPEEYGVNEYAGRALKQAFCVDSVSDIREDGDGCSFTVQTRDFLQARNNLEVRFGADGGSSADALSRCRAQAECFRHSALNCASANFCPAPGMLERSRP